MQKESPIRKSKHPQKSKKQRRKVNVISKQQL